MVQQVVVNLGDDFDTRKSRATYLVLAFCLGGLGVHNFYAGRVGSAVCQLILTCTLVGIIVSAPVGVARHALRHPGRFGAADAVTPG